MDNQDYMIGGAFMGNRFQRNENGDIVLVDAIQHVDPNLLGAADGYGERGKMITHEITEAYYGAEIALEEGVESGDSRSPNNCYTRAHNRATKQNTIKRYYLDKDYDIMKGEPVAGETVTGEAFFVSYPSGIIKEQEIYRIPYK